MKATDLFAAGYTELVSVVPPDGRLSPATHIRPESRGKVPGIRYLSGAWGGYGWLDRTVDEAFARQIDESGANIGLRASRFPAIDIDVRHEGIADMIGAIIERRAPAPMRVGQWPKRLFMYRLAPGEQPFRRLQIHFTVDGEKHLVELLATGQQYVIAGKHPSGTDYQSMALPPATYLSAMTLELAVSILDEIRSSLDMLGIDTDQVGASTHLGREFVDQDHLKGNLETLEQAIRSIPNTNSSFPTREQYIRVGYAIKAAFSEDEPRGLQLFTDWALGWEGNERGKNTVEVIESDWRRMKPPYEVGAHYLLDMARQYGFDTAAIDFPAEPAPPAEPANEDEQSDVRYSDLWVADRLVESYGGRMRFVPQRGEWYAWDGAVWRGDVAAAVPGYARRVLVDLSAKVQKVGATDKEKKEAAGLAARLSSLRQLDSVLRLARLDARVIAQATEFDASDDIIGTPGGIVDLRTGQLFDSDPSRYVSKCTATTPVSGPAPKWLAFLAQVTQGDADLLEYLQRLVGYCLTGSVKEEIFAFLYGDGGNGKSVFVDSLFGAYGSYARAAQMETFLASEYARHPTELASLAGARMVTASELREGRSWDEARIKALTGGDPITARFMREDEFTFAPKFKLLFSGNHRPGISSVDEAITRRVHLIPFTNKPQSKNKNLKTELRDEFPAILAWAVAGAVKWYARGLEAPRAVVAATRDYLAGEDAFGRWLESCTGSGEATATELYQSWTNWCSTNGENAGSQKRFAVKLSDRQVGKRRSNTGTVYGLGLTVNEFAMVQ